MPRLLSFLLLSLCLLAQTVTSAWAATAMAAVSAMAPMPIAAPQTTPPCHDQSERGDHAPASLDHAGLDHDHDQRHCKSSSDCRCLQHCVTAMPAVEAAALAGIGNGTLHWPPYAGDGRPSPYRPARPPIG